jgi:hypothetical protein
MRATREPRSNRGGFVLVVSSLVVFVVHVSGALLAQTGTVTGSIELPHFDRVLLLESTSETSANVSIGDLNGDGNLDIVLAKGRHWPLVDRVLLNDGHGRFPVAHNLGEKADRTYSASLADLDGDGDLDVVIGNDAPDPKRVYLNDGKGNFREGSTYGRPDWPMRNGSVADLNGDGLPDIIVANRTGDNSGANYICLNRGKGAFDADCLAFSHDSATTITPADFNHDGFVDLAVPHREGGQSHVYLNDGKAGFSRQVPFGPPDAAIRMTAAADLDRDGLIDIVAIDERRGGFIYFNQKDGKFSAGVPLANTKVVPYALAVGDMNLDGKVDIIVGNVEAPSTIYFNDGSGRRFTATQVGDNKGTVYGFAVGDVDKDGLPDLAVARSDAPNVVYFGASSEPRSARPALFVELKYAALEASSPGSSTTSTFSGAGSRSPPARWNSCVTTASCGNTNFRRLPHPAPRCETVSGAGGWEWE